MVRLLYYGLSHELMGYCTKSTQKKKIKHLSNTLKTIAANHQVPSLSSIQIGEAIQYFVMLNTQHLKAHQWDSYSRVRPVNYVGFLNAEIKDSSSEKAKLWEMCCSYPGIKMLIERPTSIKISYMDEELKLKQGQMHDFQARIAQHEIDHYLGVDFLRKAEKVEITQDKLREKHQQECNQLMKDFRKAADSYPNEIINRTQFHKLRQFIIYSIVDKVKRI